MLPADAPPDQPADQIDRTRLWPQLQQLTVQELLQTLPPTVRRTLEALGLVNGVEEELQRMEQAAAAAAAAAPPQDGGPELEAAVAAAGGVAAAAAAGGEAAPSVETAAGCEEPSADVVVNVPSISHKVCPGCFQPVKMEGGCNSTSCPSCHVAFCYICLRTDCVVVQRHGVCP